MTEPWEAINLTRVDLNLLAVFEVLMEERNVTQAAKRLGLSQPATSHALGRLRILLKDDVLVRGPEGMVATEKAEQLAGPIREALAGLAVALEPQSARPQDMRRRYAIAVNGYTAYVLTWHIAMALRATAPGLRLTFLPSGTRDLLIELDAGRIDLALADLTDGGDRFKCSRVMTDGYVAVMRRGHPGAQDILHAEDLARMEHLTITSTGDNTSFVDEMLEAHQLRRDIVLSLPFLAVPDALARSDLVAIMPKRVAEQVAQSWDVVACDIACDSPSINLFMTWHRRVDRQVDHRWIRMSIRDSLSRTAVG